MTSDASVHVIIGDLSRDALLMLIHEQEKVRGRYEDSTRALRKTVRARYESGDISGDDIVAAWKGDTRGGQ